MSPQRKLRAFCFWLQAAAPGRRSAGTGGTPGFGNSACTFPVEQWTSRRKDSDQASVFFTIFSYGRASTGLLQTERTCFVRFFYSMASYLHNA
jgi:hypothetical protein